jgi:hypothetical protein
MPPDETIDLNIAEDRLDGQEAIRAFVGHDNIHRTRYLLRRNMIPGVWREGERYVGSKRAIREGYLAAAGGKTAA